ncbi:hypothetical protein FAZ15_17390 [Sphingobacterium olei]|uniref:TonB C-terminal domain-containing protein n=1 Tax=Sphingobacterium olei TaxID=2571155 RepID=A0A4U0NHU6_9SPHI|nr:hypothetical protein [Sphingobacterium olei]TJZ53795.1 hypothetical protein FAZ15_17390 [Sphingobacterium olei]
MKCIIKILLLFLMSCNWFFARGQLIKPIIPDKYIIQPFSDNALELKFQILRELKFSGDAKKKNIKEILQAKIFFDQNGKICSSTPLSTIGNGVEESLVKVVANYAAKNKRKRVDKKMLLRSDTSSSYLLQLPIYMYDEKINYMSTGMAGNGIAIQGNYNGQRILVLDLSYIGKESDFTGMLPHGGFQAFVNEIGGLFTSNMKHFLSSGSMTKTGDATIKFNVDENGKLTDIQTLGSTNVLNKNFIKVLKRYAEVFRWNPPSNVELNDYEFVLYINLS